MSRGGPAPFIYQGSGKKQSLNASESQKKCTKQACAIQLCLAKSNHQQYLCEAFIEAWKKCCRDAEAAINKSK
jgi:hypothetical protein